MSANLTKRDIVLSIYESTGIPQKDVRDVVQQTLDVIAQALEEGRNVELRNFGVFRSAKAKGPHRSQTRTNRIRMSLFPRERSLSSRPARI